MVKYLKLPRYPLGVRNPYFFLRVSPSYTLGSSRCVNDNFSRNLGGGNELKGLGVGVERRFLEVLPRRRPVFLTNPLRNRIPDLLKCKYLVKGVFKSFGIG